MTLAEKYHTTPFDIFAQDANEVIILINYYVMLADEKDENTYPQGHQSDPFWDFD